MFGELETLPDGNQVCLTCNYLVDYCKCDPDTGMPSFYSTAVYNYQEGVRK
jgi:hypothetical protein